MIAAVRSRKGKGPKKVAAGLSAGPVRWSRGADRVANRALERAYPPLRRAGHLAGAGFDAAATWIGGRLRWVGRRLRPGLVLALRALARLDSWARRGLGAAARGATVASAAVTPRRAVGATIALAGAFLVASQFVVYHGVEIGQPGYANLPDVAKPPTRGAQPTGAAHAYLLVPVGVAAIALGIGCARQRRRRWGLAAAALGALAVVVALAVDLPSGLDVGTAGNRYSGVEAVLEDGFYAELAAAAALLIAGLLYYARPCRTRINLSGRAASGRRRRPRRRASSRARVARSA